VSRRSEHPEVAEFGRRVRSHRKSASLTQEQLAERAELHWTYVGQVERGQANLTLHSIVVIAAALDVDPSELVAGLKP